MVFTTLVLLAVIMVACVVGIGVIPRFDRRVPLAQPQSAGPASRASPSRDAR